MTTLVYDGSFDGWLTAVFEIYEYRFINPLIVRDKAFQQNVFASRHDVITNEAKAQRVWNGLKQKISQRATSEIYHSFLSEQTSFENTLLTYVQYVFDSKKTVEYDYTNHSVLLVRQMAHKVHRERHRMEAFIRFELTKDQVYYAVIQPDYNVLPLLENHFKRRYADQKWMIYDIHRKYGIYYDLQQVTMVTVNFSESVFEPGDVSLIYDETEVLYQSLWQQYFQSVNIQARKNMKLHIQHMPKRYWKYLTEKKQLTR